MWRSRTLKQSAKRIAVLALFAGLVAADAAGLEGAEIFLRGDVNNDGTVSVADGLAILKRVEREGPRPSCLKAADIDDDGDVDRGDFSRFMYELNGLADYREIAVPYPEPGSDPTDDSLSCDAYGGGEPLEDPAAAMEVLDVVAPGGEVGTAVIKVRISHSRPAGGYSGALSTSENVLAYKRMFRQVDGTFTQQLGNFGGLEQDGRLYFSHVNNAFLAAPPDDPNHGVLPPAENHVVLKIYVCLIPGLEAGTYPLTLEAAELVDFETARAIPCRTVSGSLTVERDVTAELPCDPMDPVPPQGPEDVRAAITIGRTNIERDGSQRIPVAIRTNVPLEGFTLNISFEADELRLIDVVPLRQDWSLFHFALNSPRPSPPFLTSSQDYLTVRAEFGGEGAFLTAGAEHEVVHLEFEVVEDAEGGYSELQFSEQGQRDGDHVMNTVRVYGEDFGPRRTSGFDFTQGGFYVDPPDEAAFLRGDVNIDGRVTISDALMVRRFLFLGGVETFPCEEAGDVDDDGWLDIADSVQILLHLFELPLEEASIAPPYPDVGFDDTIDPLVCRSYDVTPPGRTEDLVSLGTIAADPGEYVEIPIFISSSVEIEAYQLLIEYEPELFAPERGNLVFGGSYFDGREPGVSSGGYDSVRPHPEKGLLTVAFVSHLLRPGFEIPPGEQILVGAIPGKIAERAAPGSMITLKLNDIETDLGFKHLRSELTYRGEARFLSVVPQMENGYVSIVGDLTFFRRGDSNADQKVDIADPLYTLSFLFLGGPEPVCPDAADADDSGVLDLSDAVMTLQFLFNGEGSIAFPYVNRGHDPTADGLGPCEGHSPPARI